jgi:hypothetical protein
MYPAAPVPDADAIYWGLALFAVIVGLAAFGIFGLLRLSMRLP